ncbi:hypothetical protein W806_02576, partial [Staphylococcus aureus VET1923S]
SPLIYFESPYSAETVADFELTATSTFWGLAG